MPKVGGITGPFSEASWMRNAEYTTAMMMGYKIPVTDMSTALVKTKRSLEAFKGEDGPERNLFQYQLEEFFSMEGEGAFDTDCALMNVYPGEILTTIFDIETHIHRQR